MELRRNEFAAKLSNLTGVPLTEAEVICTFNSPNQFWPFLTIFGCFFRLKWTNLCSVFSIGLLMQTNMEALSKKLNCMELLSKFMNLSES